MNHNTKLKSKKSIILSKEGQNIIRGTILHQCFMDIVIDKTVASTDGLEAPCRKKCADSLNGLRTYSWEAVSYTACARD